MAIMGWSVTDSHSTVKPAAIRTRWLPPRLCLMWIHNWHNVVILYTCSMWNSLEPGVKGHVCCCCCCHLRLLRLGVKSNTSSFGTRLKESATCRSGDRPPPHQPSSSVESRMLSASKTVPFRPILCTCVTRKRVAFVSFGCIKRVFVYFRAFRSGLGKGSERAHVCKRPGDSVLRPFLL